MLSIGRNAKTALLNVRKVRKIFTRLDRDVVASCYLKGTGIEIGGLHNPLRVPRRVSVKYVDRRSVPELRKQYPELESHALTQVDIIDNGETLNTIADETQDFVIANHFLEHCENPILALGNMVRVLKKQGVLFLAIPDKRYTFDSGRPVTPFDHCLKDFQEGPACSREQHFREWVTLVEEKNDPVEAEGRVQELMGMNYSIHFHVWTQTDMLELILKSSEHLHLSADLEVLLKDEGEVIFLLSKGG
jgi:predicted SAM-dependent methyltransferase